MQSVRIWTPESDYDEEAVKCLALKLLSHLNTCLRVQTAGKSAYNSIAKHLRRNPNALRIAVEQYLQQEDYVIFVIDRDNSASLAQRRQEPLSKVCLIERVLCAEKLQGRVYLAWAIEEFEAWLLVDYVGVACYFVGKDCSSETREKIRNDKRIRGVLRRQSGNTEMFVEALPGGSGPKECLENLSKELLQKFISDLKYTTLDQRKYHERDAPELAKCIEINSATMGRNPSLERFGQILLACASSGD